MRRAIACGALAGVAAGGVMLLATLLLRLVAGVPLPTELVSDRLLPNIPVGTFLDLLSTLGGPIQAKQIGYFSAFAGQFATAVALGALHGGLTEWSRRNPGASGRRAAIARRPALVVGALLAAMLVLLLIVLWPELDASYRGLPLGAARTATIVGLTASFAIFLGALELAHRALTRPRPQAVREPAGEPLPRRAFLVGAAGVVAGLGSLGLMRRLYRPRRVRLRRDEPAPGRSQRGHAGREVLHRDKEPDRPPGR